MKFSEMPYQRPDLEQIKSQLSDFASDLAHAANYAAAKDIFLKKDVLDKHIGTLASLANIRHTIDTRDPFYDEEVTFWNGAHPQIAEVNQKWIDVLLASPFRAEFEQEFGNVTFLNAEIERKTFAPEIMEDLAAENDLTCEYEKLIASAQIPFEDGIYTLSQLTPFKNDLDDGRRLSAWKAEGNWYKEQQSKLDDIYDKLVHLRDKMGRTLGYENYTKTV